MAAHRFGAARARGHGCRMVSPFAIWSGDGLVTSPRRDGSSRSLGRGTSVSGLRRHSRNPVLTRADIPKITPFLDDVSSVFNPGAVRWNGWEEVGRRPASGAGSSSVDRLLLRVQTRGRETVLMVAESRDGESFTVLPELVEIEGVDSLQPEPIHASR